MFVQRLSQEYSGRLKIPLEECYAALSELQGNALEKLRQREHFKESGVAAVKVKLLNRANSQLLTKEISLASPALRLKEIIARDVNISKEKLVKSVMQSKLKWLLIFLYLFIC